MSDNPTPVVSDADAVVNRHQAAAAEDAHGEAARHEAAAAAMDEQDTAEARKVADTHRKTAALFRAFSVEPRIDNLTPAPTS